MASAEVQSVVDQLNAGTVNVNDLEKLYGTPAAEIQANWDAINKENN